MTKQDGNITNYIPINRKLFKHPFWDEKRTFSRFEAWLDLISEARFEMTEARRLIGGKLIMWHRGELPVSLRYLAERWNWSKNKVDDFLNLLEVDRMIVKRTAEGTSQTVITLCNYDSYNLFPNERGQVSGIRRDSKGTVRGQQGDETNKDNKEKEGKEYSGEPEYEKFISFIGWINKYAPTVNKMREPFSFEDYMKLKDKVNKERLKAYILKMHNWKPLLQKNNSAYLTILNWIEKDAAEKSGNKKPMNDNDVLKAMGL